MTRTFLESDDVHDLVADQFGSDCRLTSLRRLTGGTKKGVYRLELADRTTVILYVWAAGENYWPPSPTVPDDPFTDASVGPHYGRLAAIARGEASQARPSEDVVVDRALGHLDAVAARDVRLADARHRIAAHVSELRERVAPRQTYALVHGELGPDHVLVTSAGEPVMIDFEGLTYFDVEWEHAWLRMRFGETYPALRPVELDPDRLELYRYAQALSLIEGPLRIADTDFPDRQWMLDLAEWNITKVLAAV